MTRISAAIVIKTIIPSPQNLQMSRPPERNEESVSHQKIEKKYEPVTTYLKD